MATLGTLGVDIIGTSVGLKGTLTRAARDVTLFADNVSKSGMTMAGVLGTIGTAAGVLGAITVATFSSFEQEMTKSLSILRNKTDDTFSQMAAQALKMSTKSISSANDLARAYFYLGSAGLSAAQQMEALPTIQKFSVAGNLDVAAAAEKLVDVQNALGLSFKDPIKNGKELARVANVLAKANTIANATAKQFAASLTNKAGVAARQLGLSLEETVAVLTAYADQGIKGARAGTWMSQALRELSEAIVKNKIALRTFGIEVVDPVTGKFRGMGNVIRDLSKAYKGLAPEETKQLSLLLGFSMRSEQAIKALLGLGDKVDENKKKLSGLGDTIGEISDERLETISSKFTMLWNTIKAGTINIGEATSDLIGLKGMLDILTDGLKGIPDVLSSIKSAFNGLDKKLLISVGIWAGLMAVAIAPVSAAITAAVATIVAGIAYISKEYHKLKVELDLEAKEEEKRSRTQARLIALERVRRGLRPTGYKKEEDSSSAKSKKITEAEQRDIDARKKEFTYNAQQIKILKNKKTIMQSLTKIMSDAYKSTLSKEDKYQHLLKKRNELWRKLNDFNLMPQERLDSLKQYMSTSKELLAAAKAKSTATKPDQRGFADSIRSGSVDAWNTALKIQERRDNAVMIAKETLKTNVETNAILKSMNQTMKMETHRLKLDKGDMK